MSPQGFKTPIKTSEFHKSFGHTFNYSLQLEIVTPTHTHSSGYVFYDIAWTYARFNSKYHIMPSVRSYKATYAYC